MKDKNIDIEAFPTTEYKSVVEVLHGYGNSKIMNNWFTHELASQLEV